MYNGMRTDGDEIIVFGKQPFLHICEKCGKIDILDSKTAFDQGWDYPGINGILPESQFGVIGPRTCGNCSIDDTLWWALEVEKRSVDELTDKQLKTFLVILGEPDVLRIYDDTDVKLSIEEESDDLFYK